MRDHLHQHKLERKRMTQEFSDLYNAHFATLRGDVERFPGIQSLRAVNYGVSTDERRANLFDNLRNTEVDIVLNQSQGGNYIVTCTNYAGFTLVLV